MTDLYPWSAWKKVIVVTLLEWCSLKKWWHAGDLEQVLTIVLGAAGALSAHYSLWAAAPVLCTHVAAHKKTNTNTQYTIHIHVCLRLCTQPWSTCTMIACIKASDPISFYRKTCWPIQIWLIWNLLLVADVTYPDTSQPCFAHERRFRWKSWNSVGMSHSLERMQAVFR